MVRPELSPESKSFVEPRPAMTMPVAPVAEIPVSDRSTIQAIAVVPKSVPAPVLELVPESDPAPISNEPILVDERVDNLLREIFALTKERKELYEISNIRIKRSNEMLEIAREAKRLARAALAETDALSSKHAEDSPALAELRAWAAKPI